MKRISVAFLTLILVLSAATPSIAQNNDQNREGLPGRRVGGGTRLMELSINVKL